LRQVFETNTNPEIQIGALRLLAQFQDPVLAKNALDYAVSGKVRDQDAAKQISIALQTEETRDLAWKYIQEDWEKVQAQFTTEMGAMLVGSTGSFCSANARDDVKDFFTSHKVAASNQALRHAIEHIDGCIELRSLQEPKLKQWIAAQSIS
jgi:aminopeptidase N/puromycin-sensitive aminopeptidase